jgi:AraC family transcriptional regulator
MESKVISKESFLIVGIESKTTTRDGSNFVEIPQFWEKVLQQGRLDTIPNRKYPGTVLGFCMDFQPDGYFSYIIGLIKTLW